MSADSTYRSYRRPGEGTKEDVAEFEAALTRAQARMRDHKRARTIKCLVPINALLKFRELKRDLREGRITTDQAHAGIAAYIMPHIKLRPGVDYNPDIDNIQLSLKRAVRSIIVPR